MPGAVTFLGAADVPHCSPMVRMGFIPNVTVNGIPVSCQTHLNTPHLVPIGGSTVSPNAELDIGASPASGGVKCVGHAMPIALGSTRVKVMGLGLGRVFDPLIACTFVAMGSPNVIDHSP